MGAFAVEQVAAMHSRPWDRSALRPKSGTATDTLWQPQSPVRIGADRGLSKRPLPLTGEVQVTRHVQITKPDLDDVRIRLDTSGGHGHLKACQFCAGDKEPEFVSA